MQRSAATRPSTTLAQLLWTGAGTRARPWGAFLEACLPACLPAFLGERRDASVRRLAHPRAELMGNFLGAQLHMYASNTVFRGTGSTKRTNHPSHAALATYAPGQPAGATSRRSPTEAREIETAPSSRSACPPYPQAANARLHLEQPRDPRCASATVGSHHRTGSS
ncbi:uncharacterized protein PSFLO_02722 [Pseudozyma flocculosa]|uniref:Uncharacterized protein n=1 Tax=Pseudozyma flocculosa TaxID=84751 RepID=A0A5C3EZI2_9BASI|nr:uncharacterized protein PSFLO_02722 [Pseudozyma flocculosa]